MAAHPCINCGITIPTWVTVGNKRRNFSNRDFCLKCLDFGAKRGTGQLLQLRHRKTLRSQECLICKSEFLITHSNRKNAQVCSRKCVADLAIRKHPRVTLNCFTCHNDFERLPSVIRKNNTQLVFCSRECKDKAQRIGGVPGIQVRKLTFHPGDYRKYAIGLGNPKCIQCGYEEYVRMIDVDHKDNNRKNGSMDNLQFLCVWCHALKTRGVVDHKRI